MSVRTSNGPVTHTQRIAALAITQAAFLPAQRSNAQRMCERLLTLVLKLRAFADFHIHFTAVKVLVATHYSVPAVRNGYTRNAMVCMSKVMKSFLCRGYLNPVTSAGRTSVDIGASAELELVDN